MAAQITVIVLIVFNLTVNISSHGKECKPINARSSLISSLIWIGLLYWGGFFDCF